jgi:hypothetical protein
MTGGGVWDDMPTPPWPADGELPAPGDAAFDALLDHAPLPDGSTAPLHQLAAAFGELYAAPVDDAAAAEQYAMALFRGAAGRPADAQPARITQPAQVAQVAPARPAGRRGWRPRLSARIAAIGAVALVTLGGAAAAAAYTGALPDVLHQFTRHHPATPAATGPGSPAQPATESRSAAPGPARGLCAAYRSAVAHGSPRAQRTAFRKLAAAAGGAGNVTSYCAGVAEPRPTPGSQQSHPTHPAHPSHGAHPTHPAHPTHSAHPTHPSNGHGNGTGNGNSKGQGKGNG